METCNRNLGAHFSLTKFPVNPWVRVFLCELPWYVCIEFNPVVTHSAPTSLSLCLIALPPPFIWDPFSLGHVSSHLPRPYVCVDPPLSEFSQPLFVLTPSILSHSQRCITLPEQHTVTRFWRCWPMKRPMWTASAVMGARRCTYQRCMDVAVVPVFSSITVRHWCNGALLNCSPTRSPPIPTQRGGQDTVTYSVG